MSGVRCLVALVWVLTGEEKYLTHSLAVEATMREMAPLVGENADEWGWAGLLHDIDIAFTARTRRHGIVGAEMVQNLGFSAPVVQAIRSHDDGAGVARRSRLDHALYCADQMYWTVRAKREVGDKLRRECREAGVGAIDEEAR